MSFDLLIEALKAALIGVVEGITEWLPISSTGHMILVDEFVQLQVSPEFLALFLVVIQIGSIMAVIVSFRHKLNPFSRTKTHDEQRGTWRLWGMVVIGVIPAAVFGLLLDDWASSHLFNAYTVSAMLILYGVIFIILEQRNRRRERKYLETLEAPRGKHAAPLSQEDQKLACSRSDVSEIDWKCNQDRLFPGTCYCSRNKSFRSDHYRWYVVRLFAYRSC